MRKKLGHSNGSPHGQTYNRDVKESASGLTLITLDAKARAMWLYTKPVSSEVSLHFKEVVKNLQANNTTKMETRK